MIVRRSGIQSQIRRSAPPKNKRLLWAMGGGLISIVLLGMLWLLSPFATFRGVPVRILLQFVTDPEARSAYFADDKQGLHDRLNEMGVEEQIKAFYRPRIQDEKELDQYIHQLLYENTGYVGKFYTVNAQGILELKPRMPPNFWPWFRAAKKLGLAADHRWVEGEFLIITPQGNEVPYDVIANLYPLSDLRKMLKTRRSPKT